jgi:hypothetical protein
LGNDFSNGAWRRIRAGAVPAFGVEEVRGEVKQFICLAPGLVPGRK